MTRGPGYADKLSAHESSLLGWLQEMRAEGELGAPRSSRSRAWRFATAAGLASLIGAVWLLGNPGGMSVAYGWSAYPEVPSPALMRQAAELCATSAPLVNVDQRGNVALAQFVSHDEWTSCVFTEAEGRWELRGRASAPIRPGGRSETAVFSGEFRDDSIDLVDVDGWLPTRTHIAEIVRDDGEVVEASVNDGFVLAWWPAPVQPRSLRAFDETGRVIAECRWDATLTASCTES